ncbi:MAG: pyruvate kinase [Tissierellia bacterium]|nr:pyruvate kinase [Tissierellia bacterium]
MLSRRTKIVCTLGPATDNPEILEAVMKAGMNVARFNFSHGSHEEHKKRMDMVKQLREKLNLPVAMLIDTKGPEIRLGKIKEGCSLTNGDYFILTGEVILGDEKRASISYKDFYKDLRVGNSILIDDGLIHLRVEGIDEIGDIHTQVIVGGELKNNKGINAPGIRVNLPAFTPQDEADIIFGLRQGVDFIAPSFVCNKENVLDIRRILEDENASHVQIISKIENRQGYDHLEEILKVSDGIMVARGDLGVEMPIEEVPIAQKVMIKMCNAMGKPVITATQMLDSMIRNPSPTRAEATDVANAIFDGTDAIMLSGETAAGHYPVEAVRVMDAIARKTEEALPSYAMERDYEKYHDSVTYAVSKATVEAAHNLDTEAILTVTMSGFTAKKLAMHRPHCPIIALTPRVEIMRTLSLSWGVYPLYLQELFSTDEMFREMAGVSQDAGYVEEGDMVIITTGLPLGIAGATNLMKIHVVGEVMQKGIGIGEGTIKGRIRFAQNLHLEPLQEGDILYLEEVVPQDLALVKQVSGLITAEGGYTSLGARWARELGIPAVLGVRLLRSRIHDGLEISLDPKLGIIYNAADVL